MTVFWTFSVAVGTGCNSQSQWHPLSQGPGDIEVEGVIWGLGFRI